MRHKSTFVAIFILAIPCLAQAALNAQSYAGAKFLLELDGKSIGWLKSFEGGNAIQTPVTRGTRSDKLPDKGPGPVRYEAASIALPLVSNRALWDSINASVGAAPSALKSVILVGADASFNEKSRIGFEEPLLTGIEFPALDSAASKETALLNLTVLPSRVTEAVTTGSAKVSGELGTKTKNIMSSNFRLTIAGMSTDKVIRIDPFKITRSPKGPPEYSNLVVTVPESDIDPWKTWAAQTMEGKPLERNGKLELLSANLTEVLLTASFEGLGVVRVTSDRFDTNNSGVRRARAELYVEKITFTPPATQ